jgi:hypothetical protein
MTREPYRSRVAVLVTVSVVDSLRLARIDGTNA